MLDEGYMLRVDVVLMFPNDRNCKVNPDTFSDLDKCVDTRGYMSWTAYCH